MKGREDGEVAIDELANFVREVVPDITEKSKFKHRQIPMTMIVGDPFAIGCAKGYEKPGCGR